jgi:hypothetical protein
MHEFTVVTVNLVWFGDKIEGFKTARIQEEAVQVVNAFAEDGWEVAATTADTQGRLVITFRRELR